MAGEDAPPRLSWDQALAWRMRRQWLSEPTSEDATAVVRRLAGVQAQVPSSAVAAVAVRQAEPSAGELDRLLSDGSLLRTWAMRGTLHLLAVDEAGAFLSLLAATRLWERSSWQKTFLDADALDRLTRAVRQLVDRRVLSRDELVAGVVERTGDEALGDQVRSGWGAVLKPLAWQGILCNGPSNGSRVTFGRPEDCLPDWSGLPPPEVAASIAIPSYLGAHGPASPATFDQWLCRGVSKRASLKNWFAQLGDQLTVVDVEGERLYVRTEDLDDLLAAVADTTVRLLPAFDQYVLGPGTSDTRIIAAHRRRFVSKAAGWISPVVVAGGRVVGTWQVTPDRLDIALFDEHRDISRTSLAAEAERLRAVFGTRYSMDVTSVT